MSLLTLFVPKERVFLLLSMMCGFLISAEYAIVRPVSQSLFLHFFGAKWLPYAWMGSIPLNLAFVSLYNYLIPRWGCFFVFVFFSVLVAAGNICMGFFIASSAFCSFIFYIWKEVYILLMFQQLWSVIHSTIPSDRARYLYGMLFGVGALGGFLGGFIPGHYAVIFGSQALLICSVPLYILLVILFFFVLRHSNIKEKAATYATRSFSSLRKGMQLVFSSFLLRAIVGMSICMQVTATLADFQLQSVLEQLYPEKDLRTQCMGQMISLGNVLTMTLQFFGTFFCIRWLGLQRAHLLVPIILILGMITFLLYPCMMTASSFFIIVKAFEFSLFLVIKEMLYIPMRPEEKFQGKAIIDVFMGRFAKIGASVAILLMQSLHPNALTTSLAWIGLGILILWMVFIVKARTGYQVEWS